MAEILPNPHIALNNAKEDARQEYERTHRKKSNVSSTGNSCTEAESPEETLAEEANDK